MIESWYTPPSSSSDEHTLIYEGRSGLGLESLKLDTDKFAIKTSFCEPIKFSLTQSCDATTCTFCTCSCSSSACSSTCNSPYQLQQQRTQSLSSSAPHRISQHVRNINEKIPNSSFPLSFDDEGRRSKKTTTTNTTTNNNNNESISHSNSNGSSSRAFNCLGNGIILSVNKEDQQAEAETGRNKVNSTCHVHHHHQCHSSSSSSSSSRCCLSCHNSKINVTRQIEELFVLFREAQIRNEVAIQLKLITVFDARNVLAPIDAYFALNPFIRNHLSCQSNSVAVASFMKNLEKDIAELDAIAEEDSHDIFPLTVSDRCVVYKKLCKLYVEWWKTAFFTSSIDIYHEMMSEIFVAVQTTHFNVTRKSIVLNGHANQSCGSTGGNNNVLPAFSLPPPSLIQTSRDMAATQQQQQQQQQHQNEHSKLFVSKHRRTRSQSMPEFTNSSQATKDENVEEHQFQQEQLQVKSRESHPECTASPFSSPAILRFTSLAHIHDHHHLDMRLSSTSSSSSSTVSSRRNSNEKITPLSCSLPGRIFPVSGGAMGTIRGRLSSGSSRSSSVSHSTQTSKANSPLISPSLPPSSNPSEIDTLNSALFALPPTFPSGF